MGKPGTGTGPKRPAEQPQNPHGTPSDAPIPLRTTPAHPITPIPLARPSPPENKKGQNAPDTTTLFAYPKDKGATSLYGSSEFENVKHGDLLNRQRELLKNINANREKQGMKPFSSYDELLKDRKDRIKNAGKEGPKP